MQLANHTDTVTTWPIDRDDCFDPELVLVGNVDRAGIDGSGRAFFAIEVGDLRLKFELDERDEPIDEVGEPQVLHARFEIGEAVLQRATPDQKLRIVCAGQQPSLRV